MYVPLGPEVIHAAAGIARVLAGCQRKPEARYVLRESLAAITTPEELERVRGEIALLIRDVSIRPPDTEAAMLGALAVDGLLWDRPDVTLDLVTFGCKVVRPWRLALREDGFPLSPGRITSDSLAGVASWLVEWERMPEAATLFCTAARLTREPSKALWLLRRLDEVPPHEATPVPSEARRDLARLAESFARADRYPAAVGLGLVAASLSGRNSLKEIGGPQILKFEQLVGWARDPERRAVLEETTELADRLLQRDHPALAAEVCHVMRADEPSADWEARWKSINRYSVARIAGRRFPWLRGVFRPYRLEPSGTAAFGLPPHVSPSDVAADVLDASAVEPAPAPPGPPAGAGTPRLRSEPPAADALLQRPPKRKPPPERHVNAWLEDAELPLQVGASYRLRVDIGRLRPETVGGGPFHEPEWGPRDHLDLLIVLSGSGVHIEPSSQPARLPREGDMEAVEFRLQPLRPEMEVYLSILLAHELALLEEFRIDLSGAAAAAASP